MMKLNYSPVIAELTYMDPMPEVHTKQVQRFSCLFLLSYGRPSVIDGCTYRRAASEDVGKPRC